MQTFLFTIILSLQLRLCSSSLILCCICLRGAITQRQSIFIVPVECMQTDPFRGPAQLLLFADYKEITTVEK